MDTDPAHTTPPTPADESRRTAAVWVAGTGAFLLLAAAALFVAVRWDRIPPEGKLGLIGLLTGVFLAGGSAVRRSLPGTGDVIFHLGAFLLTVDVAAAVSRTGSGWRGLLLAEGVVASAVYPLLAAASASSVLRRAAVVSAGVLACGIAASTPLPAPLLLAVAAVLAMAAGWRGVAPMWAGVAGPAPVVGIVAAWRLDALAAGAGTGVLAELGLAGRSAGAWAVVTGALATAVLASEAQRRRHVGLAGLALVSVFTNAVTTWVAADLGPMPTYIGVAGAFLLTEVVALLVARDPFWRRPLALAATGFEAVAVWIAGPVTAGVLLVSPIIEEGFDVFSDEPGWSPHPVGAVSLTLVTLAWLVAGWRRVSDGASVGRQLLSGATFGPTVVFGYLAGVSAVAFGTASTAATGAALVVVAGLLATVDRWTARMVLVGAVVWAPVTTSVSHPALSLVLGLAAAVAAADAARRRWIHGRGAATLLAVAALTSLFGAGVIAAQALGDHVILLVLVAGASGIALLLDQAGVELGHAARLAMAIPALVALDLEPRVALPVGLLITVLYVADSWRLDLPAVGVGAAFAVQLVTASAARLAGLDRSATGVALAVSAVVWAGFVGVAADRWRVPFVVATALAVVAGAALAASDAPDLANVLLIGGGLAIGAGMWTRRLDVGHAGAAVVVVGTLIHLGAAGVDWPEAYLAPVTAQLLVLGTQLRRKDRTVSSWVAHAPAIAVFGGVALAERVAGGAGGHALVAGAVAVVAVVAGGWLRLAGPLLVGTVLAVSVTVHESVGTLVGVPTWFWLAVGGAALLASGIAMERTGQGPATTGRRLVDVVSERFE